MVDWEVGFTLALGSVLTVLEAELLPLLRFLEPPGILSVT